MDLTEKVGQKATGFVGPVDANGQPSTAVLSNVVFTASDPTIFSFAPDPNNPQLGLVVTGLANGTAQLSATATATETDGTTVNQISGSATVTISPAGVGVASSLVFTFGPAS